MSEPEEGELFIRYSRRAAIFIVILAGLCFIVTIRILFQAVILDNALKKLIKEKGQSLTLAGMNKNS